MLSLNFHCSETVSLILFKIFVILSSEQDGTERVVTVCVNMYAYV